MPAKINHIQVSGVAGPASGHVARLALRPRRDSPCGGRWDATSPPPATHPGLRACLTPGIPETCPPGEGTPLTAVRGWERRC
jgi:hypothetical protein